VGETTIRPIELKLWYWEIKDFAFDGKLGVDSLTIISQSRGTRRVPQYVYIFTILISI